MIAGLKPYADYRDSGLPWLGQVPAHWRVVRNGSLFAQRSQTGFAELPILEVSLKTGVQVRSFGAAKRKQIMSDLSKYKRAAQGDLAYNTMRMWQGALGVCPVDGLVSPAYVVARPYPDVEPRYLAALFRTGDYMAEIDSASRGIVKDRNRLYWDQFKQMQSPIPPHEEQLAIVRFLDWANGRMDRAIRAKRRVISLLMEQKQAIVRRAVTRGLAENVPLNDTKIPWLGVVPQHWQVVSLGRLSMERCDGPFGSGLKSQHYTETGVRVIRLQNIGSGEFRERGGVFISPEHYATLGDHDVVEGDLLVAGLGDDRMPAGRACIAPPALGPAMVKADCFRFRVRTALALPQYLSLHLSSTAAAATACLSTGATRQRINLQSTATRSVALPPVEEQQQIVEFIASAVEPLIVSISKIEQEIALIREFRTRIAADVVTGKLDVREAAMRLPDEEVSAIEADSADEADDPELIDEEVTEA